MGWRRTARPYGSQKLGQKQSPKHDQKFSPILLGSGRALRGWAERPSAQARRFYEPQKHNLFALGPNTSQEHSPKLAPILRPVSASLRLRCRSAGAARHPKVGRVCS